MVGKRAINGIINQCHREYDRESYRRLRGDLTIEVSHLERLAERTKRAYALYWRIPLHQTWP